MKLAEIRKLNKEFLAPTDVAEVLCCAPYSINIQAKKDITALPFPAFMINSRVRIPREAFIDWCEKVKLK